MIGLIAHAAVAAGPDGASDSSRPGSIASQRILDAKLRLLERMLSGESAARVEAGDDAVTAARLRSLRELREAAHDLQRRGALEAAGAKADEALRLLGELLRASPTARESAADWRSRYAEVQARVRAFHEAYARILAEKSRVRGGVLDEGATEALAARAQQLAREGRYREGVALLEQAAAMIERALTQLRNQETLTHELKFETPDQEYAYEAQRNRSYELLVELMIAEGRLPVAATQGARSALNDNATARRRAEAIFQSGDPRAAIVVLETATSALTELLRRSGLPLP